MGHLPRETLLANLRHHPILRPLFWLSLISDLGSPDPLVRVKAAPCSGRRGRRQPKPSPLFYCSRTAKSSIYSGSRLGCAQSGMSEPTEDILVSDLA